MLGSQKVWDGNDNSQQKPCSVHNEVGPKVISPLKYGGQILETLSSLAFWDSRISSNIIYLFTKSINWSAHVFLNIYESSCNDNSQQKNCSAHDKVGLKVIFEESLEFRDSDSRKCLKHGGQILEPLSNMLAHVQGNPQIWDSRICSNIIFPVQKVGPRTYFLKNI